METSFTVNGDGVQSPVENVELQFQSSEGIKLIEHQPEISSISIIPRVPTELEIFSRQLWGKGLYKDNEPPSYRQLLPNNTLDAACDTFQCLGSNEKDRFVELFNRFNTTPMTANNLLAMSTLFSVLAYGGEFSRAFLDSEQAEQSLNNCVRYFNVQQNFEQNYLNSCVGTSTFTVLSTAFAGNVQLLNIAINMHIQQIQTKLDISANDPMLSEPAFSSCSWRNAPTIKEEVERRIGQCTDTIGKINELFRNNQTPSSQVIKDAQRDLSRAFERMCAIKDVFTSENAAEDIDKPVLLSKRPVSNFAASCLLVLSGNILLKTMSLGFCVGSLKLYERLDGISPIENNALIKKRNPSQNTFENQDLKEIWKEIFNSGITLETRKIITGDHCVAVKAIIAENGNKSLVVYDPLKKEPEIISVS
jgi:hypothetical protein